MAGSLYFLLFIVAVLNTKPSFALKNASRRLPMKSYQLQYISVFFIFESTPLSRLGVIGILLHLHSPVILYNVGMHTILKFGFSFLKEVASKKPFLGAIM